METWMIIVLFPNYSVSDQGRVRNNTTGKLVRPSNDRQHFWVLLELRGETYPMRVDFLVAAAFITAITPNRDVQPIDGNFRNVSVDNLEIVTTFEHRKKYYRHDPKGSNSAKSVRIVETGEVFPSISACAKAIEGKAPSITAQLYGRVQHHRGYTFEWV